MRKTFQYLLTLSLATLAHASAADLNPDFSLLVSSDYVFRGVSQNDDSAVVQLEASQSFANGMHYALWASNIDFAEVENIDWASIEIDVTLGQRRELADEIELDYGLIFYQYPGGDGNYQEIYAAVDKGAWSLGLNYSPEYFNDTGRYWALSGGMGKNLTSDISIDIVLRYNRFESEKEFETFMNPARMTDNPDNSERDYWDWEINLWWANDGINWGLSYRDSDIDIIDSQCGDACDDRWLLSMGFDW